MMPIKKREDKASRKYWKIVEEAKQEVESWPKWKQRQTYHSLKEKP